MMRTPITVSTGRGKRLIHHLGMANLSLFTINTLCGWDFLTDLVPYKSRWQKVKTDGWLGESPNPERSISA